MKNLSIFAIFLVILFITSGTELTMVAGNEHMMVDAIGSCDHELHGGGCTTAECDSGCKTQYGQDAHGFCYAVQNPDDTCMCRSPC